MNYGPGDVVPNLVFAKIGSGGKVCIYTKAATDIIADVSGWYGLRVYSGGTADLPGAAAEVPGVIASVIDVNTRPTEVSSVSLTAGQTVLFEPDVPGSQAYFELYTPDVTILWESSDREFSYTRSVGSWTFTPATSGDYKLRVRAQQAGRTSTLTMRNV